MRILLSGSTGLIGAALKVFLEDIGYEVVCLKRTSSAHISNATPSVIYWDPIKGNINKQDFEGFDAVIHLAGKSIADGRWTSRVKRRLFVSRCRDSWLLSQVLNRLYSPPQTVICASAIGYYGSQEGQLVEESPPGKGFLSDLCQQWESSMQAIANRGSRVVFIRFGVVLSQKGGMLAKLLPIFKMGLGGKLGNGQQWMSWVSIHDVVGAIYHLLTHPSIIGAVNIVSPQPIVQKEFAKTLSKYLGRSMWLSLPAWLLRLCLGEKADALLLCNLNVKPQKLIDAGYHFKDPDLARFLEGLI